MIIDFHTHTFPDAIAEKTIAYLTEKGGIKPYREGTLSSLIENMKLSGVDYSVVLPVVTAPKQERPRPGRPPSPAGRTAPCRPAAGGAKSR